MCFLGAGLQYLINYWLIVVLAGRSQRCIALVHLLTQVAVVGILQQRQAAGGVQGEHPFAFETTVGGFFGGHVYARLGQA